MRYVARLLSIQLLTFFAIFSASTVCAQIRIAEVRSASGLTLKKLSESEIDALVKATDAVLEKHGFKRTIEKRAKRFSGHKKDLIYSPTKRTAELAQVQGNLELAKNGLSFSFHAPDRRKPKPALEAIRELEAAYAKAYPNAKFKSKF